MVVVVAVLPPPPLPPPPPKVELSPDVPTGLKWVMELTGPTVFQPPPIKLPNKKYFEFQILMTPFYLFETSFICKKFSFSLRKRIYFYIFVFCVNKRKKNYCVHFGLYILAIEQK